MSTEPNSIGMGSSEFHVIRVDEKIALTKYVFSLLNREVVRKDAEDRMTGSSGHRRVPAFFYESYQLPVPNKNIQEMLIKEIEKQENIIKKAKDVMDSIADRKKEIINKYL